MSAPQPDFTAAQAAPLPGLPAGKPRVLAVDDQPVHLQVLHELFRHDYQLFVATSGERALEICRDHAPDLVLLDVAMPGMDGYEVCARLKAQALTRDIPVIFLTAHTDPAEETRALELGAVDFIAKPINPAVVRARVRTHITLKHQGDSLRKLAFLDGLTGVYNRRYLDQQLPIELARACRSMQPLSMMMIDVDCFKSYNDHYGHLAGDDALRAVVRCVAQCLRRPGDMVARFGGEEFVCVLPETPFEAAMALGREMERQVRGLGIVHAHGTAAGCVTISLGVVTREHEGPQDHLDLLAAADAQVYQAKRAGRATVRGTVARGPASPASAPPA